MKKILIVILSLFSFNLFSQDTIEIPQSELDEIIAVMDTLVEQDSINNILITQQKQQIHN